MGTSQSCHWFQVRIINVGQGHQLIKVSIEVRASDIKQKVTRLEDKLERVKAVIGFR